MKAKANELLCRRFHVRQISIVILAVGVFYIISAGAVRAVGRHMADGHLQWLRSYPFASALMEAYEWPARQASVFPPFGAIFEFSGAFWMQVTDAPETTG